MDELEEIIQTDANVWVIQPRGEGLGARLRDVWRYRRLMRFFATKTVQRLYQGTVLGWAWIFIRPLFPLLVNTLIFGGMLGVGSQGVPYFLFLVAGTSIWELFGSSVMWGTRSLQMNRGFMSRIYIPRLIMPVASMAPAYVNLLISLAVFLIATIYYRVTTGVIYLTPTHFGWALVAIGLTAYLAVAISLWTSVPALQARDVRLSLNYVMGFWVFLTPVLYPIRVPAQYAWVISLNPMAAIVNAFKYGVLGIDVLNLGDLGIAALMTTGIFTSGLWYFSRAEADAADKV
jgi:lipopolysaccharide transport system permease protein